VVVEGPLAGGHLGFGEDWRNFKLEDIVKDVVKLVKDTGLNVPVLGAGGIFSGKEAVELVRAGSK
jgi:nitronate monooxygenase